MVTIDAPEGAVSTCRKDCEHFDLSMTAKEFAHLVEGVCIPCGLPSDGRSDDGFASCSCCKVEWKVEGGTCTVRAPVRIIPEQDDD